jgi:hypothetical protein
MSYVDGDRSRVVAEIAPLHGEGMNLKEARGMVIVSNGFEVLLLAIIVWLPCYLFLLLYSALV